MFLLVYYLCFYWGSNMVGVWSVL